MQDRKLFVSDIHLTDNKEDEYRWELFPFLKKQALQNDVNDIFLLGDITDKKDRHSGLLLNRIKDAFLELQESTGANIYILLGNHDYMPGSSPPLEFLGQLRSKIEFITEAEELEMDDGTTMMAVPFCMYDGHVYEQWWNMALKAKNPQLILAHETFSGAVVSNGMKMEGQDLPDSFVPVVSGDVHVPQTVGNVTYVGSPYPVKFGDEFEPRCLLLDEKGEWQSIPSAQYLPNRFSWEVRDAEELDEYLGKKSKSGDQIKLRMTITEQQIPQWSELKSELQEICDKHQVEVHGIEITQVSESKPLEDQEIKANSKIEFFEYYCQEEGVDGYLYETGRSFLDEY